ncbi:MAG: sugar transferase, partial [Planctomycetota bacterium]
VDFSFAFLAGIIGFVATPYIAGELDVQTLPFSFGLAITVSLVSHIAGLHDPRFSRSNLDSIGKVIGVVCLSMAILLIELWIVHYLRAGRYIVFTSAITCIAGMILVRLIAWRYSQNFGSRVCFLGDDAFRYNASLLTSEQEKSIRVIDEPQTDNLTDWAIDNQVDEIIYDPLAADPIDDEALLSCLDQGVKVSSYADFVEDNFFFVPVDGIDAKWLLTARLDLAHPYYNGIKRIVDIVAAIVGLIITSPILLASVIAIKLESSGPAFYSQIRSGRFNRPFSIYKLRTMVQDAEKDGAKWASKSDSRITKIGNFLRKTRIDEIPQFWNVLRGEMSLVGPRPERPQFVSLLSEEIPFYVQRHLVKPGLTGWAQINYPYGASVEDAKNKLTFDLYYVKRASIMLDLQILLRTIGAMMKGSR